MKSFKKMGVVAGLMSVFVLAGCLPKKKASQEIDYGKVENSVYKNNYFNLSFKVPEKWSIQNQQQTKELVKQGQQLIAGEDENMNAMIKASELQTVNLLIAFKHPVGTPVAFNPSVICMAERIRHMPGIKRGKDYQFHTKKALDASQMKVTCDITGKSVKFTETDFDIMNSEMSVVNMSVKQSYYTTIKKGYALSFIISYTSEEEHKELMNVLDSVDIQNI